MCPDRSRRYRAIGPDPLERLRQDLPPLWRGPFIGPGITDWDSLLRIGATRQIRLDGLPEGLMTELAWMARWQALDGARIDTEAINQLATIVRAAGKAGRPVPTSMHGMDWPTTQALQGWYYAKRWGRLPPRGGSEKLRILTRFARLALIARCHDGPWWQLDHWHPRCDPRIPIAQREPDANFGCSPGRMAHPWLREAVKWHLGTMLDAGTLRWATISANRLPCLIRFDRWLSAAFADPRDVLGDPVRAPGHAAAFRRWTADPRNRRSPGPYDRPHQSATVSPRAVNEDLRAVAELFAFVAANRVEATRIVGSSAWEQLTEAHAGSWFRQVSRIPRGPELNNRHYVDDHALAQITAALPLMRLPRDEQMLITRGDGTQVFAAGFEDPQAMRMILLQILTGRRVSEIRTCAFDCLSPVPHRGVEAAEGGEVTQFHYAQSKIDNAPDYILVDQEVTALIAEQQQWVRERCLDTQPRFLFVQRLGNRTGAKPYSQGTYSKLLRKFSDAVSITDGAGRAVSLSHTHRFRHTRLTRLAELGLPIKVLQRYAGHATPTMSMRYVAQREEHAEQAFLATAKLKADGTRMRFSRDDHDSLHLLDRADRFLPNGWCLLPPLQTCDKGNACLTCSVFVTDDTHQAGLERQLTETAALISRATGAFQDRHGRPMPADNVWLSQRRAEHEALTRLLAAMRDTPDRAVRGAGCGSIGRPPAGPVPLTLDSPHRRRTQP